MNTKIVGPCGCPATLKLLIAADYAGIKSTFESPKDCKTCPIVITPEGVELCGTSAGLRYFARIRPDLALYGQTFLEAAQVDSLLSTIETQILVPLYSWACWTALKGGCIQKIKSDVQSTLSSSIEPRLLKTTFLVGERLTIADLHLACSLSKFSAENNDLLASLPNTQRWLNLIVNQSLVKKHLATINSACKQDSPKKIVSKPAEPQQVTDAPKPTQSAKPESTKKGNPLDDLPPSPFVLDAWKREYSNSKDLKGTSMPWFWKNYDAEGWSLWYMRYDKVEGENTVGFLTANMLGGFLQRLDNNFRKYSFSSLNVVGEAGDFDIQGVWLFRGQSIPFEMKDHPSFEYNTFRKLDATKPEDKQLVEDYWCNTESVENRRIDSGKVWK